MALTLVLEGLTGAIGAPLMHQPVAWRPPLLMTRSCPHPRKPSMPPPPTGQGLDPDPRPAALKLNKLPRSGDSMVRDGNAIAAARRKGAWGTSTAAPSDGKPLAFEDLRIVFAQHGAAIIPARIGDLISGISPGRTRLLCEADLRQPPSLPAPPVGVDNEP
jgi:hypothetical protein